MTDRREFHDLADPDVAAETIRSLDLDPGVERVSLTEARGRVLAARVDATLDVPGFDRASMDGYAVRARDTFGADEAAPAVFDLIGEVHAGTEPDLTVKEGTAAEISTGAVMPSGADAVVMVERTDPVESQTGDEPAAETIAVRTSVAPGDHVMHAGTDIAAGERALGPGTRLTPREIGLLSALGVETVLVRDRPRVGVISTGDELVRPGGTVHHRRGQIFDVNTFTISSAIEEAGGEPVVYPHAGDDPAEMEHVLLQAAAECDLVLSSGSTSASAVDVIYRVVEERGDLLLHGVAVKPGKPMLVGTVGESAYVGLPGYPVSALTIFRTFVAPVIRDAARLSDPDITTISGIMATEERYEGGRRRLMPAGLLEDGTGNTLVYPVDKGSGATTSLVEADGIVEVPADTDYLSEGERVTVELFSPDVRPPSLLGVGEDDPVLSRLFDKLASPRYLAVGSREGLRRLRDGLPDVCVTAGPLGRDVATERLGGWTREWGLIVAPDNAEAVEGLADLVDRDLRLVNRGRDSGLRTSFDEALSELATEQDVSRHELTDSIDGYGLTVRAHESPARKVLDGEADVGLGLRETASKLELGFVSLGTQEVQVLANPDRVGKPGVEAVVDVIEHGLDDVLDGLVGFGR